MATSTNRTLPVVCLLLVTALPGVGLAAAPAGFAAGPRAERRADGSRIVFALSAPTDVEVAVLASDGTVVRHLAAGVLGGPNPPPPPLKPGLAQSLEWDGKDDFGKPAAGGPFKVRVRAGTGVRFGRFIGQDPYTFGHINSLATDADGNLYATASAGDCNQYAPTLRAFGPDGKYLRTLVPFPATLPPESVAAVAAWDEGRKSYRPKNFQSGNPMTYPFEVNPDGVCVVSAGKAGVLLTSGTNLFRADANGGAFAGPTPMWSKAAALKNPAWNTPHLAASPDGRYVYYANVAGTKYQPKTPADTDPQWPQGRVYRQDTTKPGSDPEPFFDLELPDWKKTKYWLPDAWNKRTAAYNVTTDAAGHVYVCDLVNQQIVEVGVDGKKISATPAPWPERVHVGPGGDYYLVCRLDKPKDGRVGKKLLKITGRGPAAKVAIEMLLADRLGEATALGRREGKPVLWLAGGPSLVCLRDAGDKFEPIDTAFKPRADGQVDWARVALDAGRDEVYVNNGTSLTYRYDGRTGDGGLLRKDGKPFYCVDAAVGYDGLLYLRTGDSFSGPLGRYNRDLTPAPFPGTDSHVLYDLYGRMGIGYSDKGVGVGPAGECYTYYMYGWNAYFVAGFDAGGKAVKGKYLAGKIKPPDAKSPLAKWPEDRLVSTAVVGPVSAEGGGVAVDLAGNLYVGMRLLPKDFASPAGLEKDAAYAAWSGSIVKFPPTGGAVVGAVKGDDPPAGDGPRVECKGGKAIVGALAVYPGLGPFSGGGYGGNSSACVCRVSRFAIDAYGRLSYANAVTCSATLLDNAGNKILEFGGYGNFDAGPGGPEVPLAWPTGAAASDGFVYVLDTYNKRVVRADKTWAAEAAVDVR